MNKIKDYILSFFNSIKPGKVTIFRAFLISIFSIIYSLYAVRWTSYYPSARLFLLELPLLWIIYTVFHFVNAENSRWRRIVCEIIPLFIIAILYGYYDYFFTSWNRTPRFSDMKNIPSLVGVWGVMGFILKALPIILLCLAFIAQIRSYYRSHPEKNIIKGLGLRLFYSLCIVTIMVTPIGKFYLYDVVGFEQWSDKYNMQQNGRISSMFFYEQKHRDQLNSMQEEIKTLKDSKTQAVVEQLQFDRKPNTYVILLESFFNPHEFKQFKLDHSVIYEGLTKYLPPSGKFDVIKAPVFGAGTAQSEFEILTGAPAMQMLDTIEFNSLHGAPTYSICQQFLGNGYRTEAVVATSPGFYNSVEAYESLNFQHVNYLNGEDSCLQLPPSDSFPFDSEVLPTVITQKDKFEQPYFGYILTMFGHRPYRRDLKLYPDLVVAKDAITGDPLPRRVNDCINGIYYKSKDISNFLDQLYADDPTAIVFLSSDHLPDICREYTSSYLEGRKDSLHDVPAMLIDSRKAVKLDANSMFEAHYEILNLLTQKHITITADSLLQKKRYLEIMQDGFKDNLTRFEF